MLQHLNIRTVNNSFLSLSVDSEATIKSVKDRIGSDSYEGQEMLLLNGKILQDTHTLSESKIMNNDILEVAYLCFGGMQIFVKTFSGKTLGMQVDGKTTVNDLKDKICFQLGYPPESQRLMFGPKELQGHLTLDQYSIPADAAIYIVGRLLGGV